MPPALRGRGGTAPAGCAGPGGARTGVGNRRSAARARTSTAWPSPFSNSPPQGGRRPIPARRVSAGALPAGFRSAGGASRRRGPGFRLSTLCKSRENVTGGGTKKGKSGRPGPGESAGFAVRAAHGAQRAAQRAWAKSSSGAHRDERSRARAASGWWPERARARPRRRSLMAPGCTPAASAAWKAAARG